MRTYGLYLDRYLGEGDGVARPDAGSEDEGMWIDEQGQLVAIVNGAITQMAAKVIPTNARTVQEVFEALKKQYDPASSSTVIAEVTRMLEFDFAGNDSSVKTFDQKMTDYTAIVENVNAKKTTIDELASIVLMRSLPSSFSTTLKIQSAGKDRPPSIESLNNNLRSDIVLRSSRPGSSSSNAESALYGSTSPSSSRSNTRSQEKPPTTECPVCKNGLHWAKNCKDDRRRDKYFEEKKKKAKEREGKTKKQTAKVAEEDGSNTETGGVAESSDGSRYKEGDGWMALGGGGTTKSLVLDTGATCHLTGNANLLYDIKSCTPTRISGLGGTVIARKSGQMAIRTPSGRSLTLGKVLIVDGSKHTLISTGALHRSFGFNFSIEGATTTTTDENGDIVFTASSTNGGLAIINASVVDPPREFGLSAAAEIDRLTAHRRLCHLSTRTINRLGASTAISGFRLSPDDTIESVCNEVKKCSTCLQAKLKQLPFPPSSKRAQRRLDLIHSDLLDMGITSVGGKRYVITFLDDHSRYLYVALLANKSDALDAFKEFVARAERMTGEKVKALRTDNGSEYVNKAFESHLKLLGIEHQRSIDYTPRDNSRAERVNGTITPACRAFLLQTGLGPEWWGEGISTVVYIYNRTPHSSIKFKIPILIWTEKETLDLSHLRAPGCEAYVFVPKEKRKKLEPTAKRMLLLGYGLSDKHFRLLDLSDPSRRRVVRARSATFNESVFPLASRQEDYISGSLKASQALPPSVCPSASRQDGTQTLLTPPSSSTDVISDDSDSDDDSPVTRRSAHAQPTKPKSSAEARIEKGKHVERARAPSRSSSPTSSGDEGQAPNARPRDPGDLEGSTPPRRGAPPSRTPHPLTPPAPQPSLPPIAPRAINQPSSPSAFEEPSASTSTFAGAGPKMADVPPPPDWEGGERRSRRQAAVEEKRRAAEDARVGELEENPFDELVRGGAFGEKGGFEAYATTATSDGETIEMFTLPSDDPKTTKEALADKDAPRWIESMLAEFWDLADPKQYDVYDIVSRSSLPSNAEVSRPSSSTTRSSTAAGSPSTFALDSSPSALRSRPTRSTRPTRLRSRTPPYATSSPSSP